MVTRVPLAPRPQDPEPACWREGNGTRQTSVPQTTAHTATSHPAHARHSRGTCSGVHTGVRGRRGRVGSGRVLPPWSARLSASRSPGSVGTLHDLTTHKSHREKGNKFPEKGLARQLSSLERHPKAPRLQVQSPVRACTGITHKRVSKWSHKLMSVFLSPHPAATL